MGKHTAWAGCVPHAPNLCRAVRAPTPPSIQAEGGRCPGPGVRGGRPAQPFSVVLLRADKDQENRT